MEIRVAMADRKFIDPEALLERLDVKFVRRGDQLWASCPHPEHEDSTPSWRINIDPEHPKYLQHRCYGCGFGGWPVHLVEGVFGCSREDAWQWLADVEANPPPLPFSVAVDFQSSVIKRFALPPGVVTGRPLAQWPEAPRRYLLEERGVPAWQVERWSIGYATGKWDRVNNRLTGRVVIPVYTRKGKLIGYTGRTYCNQERRYKEPSKAEGADLGAVFGEQHWPKRRHAVVVTEGAFDALAVERVMRRMPIAGIYGSQLQPGHIARLSAFPLVLMATDPDKAGNRVAGELEENLRRWTRVVRVEIPDGHDCASVEAWVLQDCLADALARAREQNAIVATS